MRLIIHKVLAYREVWSLPEFNYPDKTTFPAVQDHRLQFVDYVIKQGLVIFVALSFRLLGQDFLRNRQVQQQW